jgi:hypothetical protein
LLDGVRGGDAVRRVFPAVVGVVIAVVAYGALVVAVLLIGGADCYSGDCNFLGDAAAHDPWVFFAAEVAISAALGFVAARAVR